MITKILIIGAPEAKISGSVNMDLKRSVKKFQLPQFGAHSRDNIIVLPNPTLSEIMQAKKRMKADYSITIFSGHAGTNEINGSRILNLTNGEWLRDTDLLNGNDRELVLIDGCGSWTQTGIAGVADESSYSNFLEEDYSEIRSVYSNWVKKCGKAKLILHATKPGQKAAAAPYGGVFLTSLLNAATKYKGEIGKYRLVSIQKTAGAVLKELGGYLHKQTPSITLNQGDTENLPFAIGLPLPKPAKKEEPNYAPLAWGLLGIGVIALIAGAGGRK